jgi:LPS sulfotransferase NodH
MTPSRNQIGFMLFFQGRSGSTYLIEALASHPEIYARGEGVLGGGAGQQLRRARKFLTQLYPERYHAVGFKTKFKDVQDPERLAKLLREVEAHIILLQRRNSIKHVVSFYNSLRIYEATGDWNLYNKEDRLPPVTIDMVRFASWLEALEDEKRKLETYVKNLGLPTLSLWYEDLIVDQPATLESVFSFLGVQFKPVQGACIKNTSDDLRKAVSNFDELRARYIGTPYEWMFDEVLT